LSAPDAAPASSEPHDATTGQDEADIYTHGHHESVLRSHTWRTAENSAGYLLGHLKPGLALLDVGCGPGTITLDLASRVAPGQVLGLDRDAGVLEGAERLRSKRGVENVRFTTGDVYGLEIESGSFDVVHAHQVLQHLADPVKALGEMRRVLRPAGVLAVRDSDYGAKIWGPQDALLDRWMALYHEVTRANRAEADAGRYLPGWVREAGFVDIRVSSSTWTFADPETTKWWGELWADRVEKSSFAEQALSYGFSDREELSDIAGAWHRWSAAPGAFIVIIGVEVLASS
jgi:ubiquinone/menaquinone biosynthesis C-methylase UbiE